MKNTHVEKSIYSSANRRSIYCRFVKKFIDTTFAIILFFALLPLNFIISIAIVIDTGLPILYKSERGGCNGKTFQIYKFRSMIQNADKLGGGTTALDDKRVTKVGQFIRKIKLDEIAQIINIIRGEMSFVGPRPELLKYTSHYSEKEKIILEVKPGITDYSSIVFINLDEVVGSENADEMYEKYVLPKKNQLRIKYAETISFETDMKLLFETLLSVMKKTIKYLNKYKPRGYE